MAIRELDARFNVENFSLRVSDLPAQPDLIVDQFEEVPVASTQVEIELRGDSLALVQTTERGGPGVPKHTGERRQVEIFKVPHIETFDVVLAEQVQGVRQLGGTAEQAQPYEAEIDARAAQLRADVDLTRSNMALGAFMGVVRDADGTVIYNYFNRFGVTPEPTVYFGLGTGQSTSIRRQAMQMKRTMHRNLGLGPTTQFGVLALVGDEFWDELLDSEEAREAFKLQQDNEFARKNYFGEEFTWAGITWRNYMGTWSEENGAGDTESGFGVGIKSDEARFAPIGIQGLYKVFNAPADYAETVNTRGLSHYAKQVPYPNRDEEKGRKVVVQSNPLFMPVRPKSLMKGKLGKNPAK